MTAAGWRTGQRLLVAICHAVLLGATAAWCLTLQPTGPLSALLIAAASLPLLFAVRGLLRDQRYTYQWLRLVLVLYTGASSAEVVASQRTAPAAVIMMAAALSELLLVLVLLRFARSTRRE